MLLLAHFPFKRNGIQKVVGFDHTILYIILFHLKGKGDPDIMVLSTLQLLL